MRRVAVTGMGIVSCLGNTLDDVSTNLDWHASGESRMRRVPAAP